MEKSTRQKHDSSEVGTTGMSTYELAMPDDFYDRSNYPITTCTDIICFDKTTRFRLLEVFVPDSYCTRSSKTTVIREVLQVLIIDMSTQRIRVK